MAIRRFLKVTTGALAVTALGGYAIDRTYYYSTFTRNIRALWTGLVVGIDYKLNFTAAKAAEIEKLHYR